jgi:hypothetical protein
VALVRIKRPPHVGEVNAKFADREGVAWSAQRIHMTVNLGFLDRSHYFSIQVAPQLSSRGWVDPVPDPLLLRKTGSAGNRPRDLWICSQELWPLDHTKKQSTDIGSVRNFISITEHALLLTEPQCFGIWWNHGSSNLYLTETSSWNCPPWLKKLGKCPWAQSCRMRFTAGFNGWPHPFRFKL